MGGGGFGAQICAYFETVFFPVWMGHGVLVGGLRFLTPMRMEENFLLVQLGLFCRVEETVTQLKSSSSSLDSARLLQYFATNKTVVS